MIKVLGQLAVCNFCNFTRTKLNVFDTRTCWQQEELQGDSEIILNYLLVCGHKGAPDLTQMLKFKLEKNNAHIENMTFENFKKERFLLLVFKAEAQIGRNTEGKTVRNITELHKNRKKN